MMTNTIKVHGDYYGKSRTEIAWYPNEHSNGGMLRVVDGLNFAIFAVTLDKDEAAGVVEVLKQAFPSIK